MQSRLTMAICVAGSVLLAGEATAADVPTPDYTFTGNVALTSQYIYRGIGQSDAHPAAQGGFDFTHKSGLYLGTWGSSISWLSDASVGSFPAEWDFYGGYRGTFSGDLGFDVGVLEYDYPGTLNAGATSPDTLELYGAMTYKWTSLKFSRSTGNLFGVANSHGSGYIDLTLSPDIGNGWALAAHVGRQTVANLSAANYDDWKLGISKDVGLGSVGLTYTGTNAKGGAGEPYANVYGKNLGRGQLVLSFSKTM